MKKIRAKYVKWDNDYLVKIVEQTHRGDEFGEGCNSFFIDLDGQYCWLISASSPEYIPSEARTTWLVRGSNRKKDEAVMVMKEDEYRIFCKLLREYNNYFKCDFGDTPQETLPVEWIE